MASLVIVLVDPERPANVGAAARAMKNFGLDDLRLIGGHAALPGGEGHGEARALAWNAGDLLERARTFPSLPAAVDDLHLVAAATAKVAPGGDVLTPRELAAEVARLPEGAVAGCVFGPEDHGLSNEQLDACRMRVRIPTASAQPSLNLAQAVVVVSYEIAMARSDAAASPAAREEPAREGDIERLSAAFRALALEAGFLNPQAPEHLLGEMRRLLARARPTAREIVLLQGLVAQLAWAQRNLPRE